jgi:SH3 domain-containing YSC84-like protein 1
MPIWAAGVLIAALSGQAAQNDTEVRRVQEAAAVLSELATAPDRTIPRAVLERAEAIAVFPGVKKAGFVVGGQWGRGVIAVRDASGAWSAPAFLRLAGGSFGAQIGAQAVDLVLVVMNRRGVENLLRNEFKIGGEASATSGPVGREASASTDIQMRAESYSRAAGDFSRARRSTGRRSPRTVTPTRTSTGQPLTSKEVVGGKANASNAAAAALRDALMRNVPVRNASN